jgi:lysyl-tRNA synthetase class 2
MNITLKDPKMSLQEPEYRQHGEFQNRSAKLSEIRNLGIDPYPHKYSPTHTAQELLEKYASEEVGHSEDAASGTTLNACVAGRVVLFRSMGKNAFGHIQDATGRIQIMFNRDLTEVEGLTKTEELTPIKFIEKKIDLGDIIGIEGNLFRTQKGELTLFAKKVTLLCKTLLPLPDKHSGLADKGVRYRKRWLDLIVHPEVVEQFQMRSRIIQIVRRYCENLDFLEVETPVLQNVYGGAAAKPKCLRPRDVSSYLS